MTFIESQPSSNTARSNEAKIEVLLPIEKIEAQIPLMHTMVPDKLKHHIGSSDYEHVGLEDKLFELWAEKYAKRFSDYCEANKADAELIEQIKASKPDVGCKLSDEKYKPLVKYLVDTAEEGLGGPFIEDPEEFLRKNLH